MTKRKKGLDPNPVKTDKRDQSKADASKEEGNQPNSPASQLQSRISREHSRDHSSKPNLLTQRTKGH
ncbi:hypothetical protein PCANC_04056 [Puccinia coronata f. sp. avenae]|uniref:Uncharacterized protein n=1 Tax=Puccinia coronata f. sp. avenae TaxID=200324 RepID=A0A2N5W215_9BASI|nr:hypothetical protein PCASD_07137 [Puccinia coronata f. sp. avenae]PLW56291.1 hypothetical protein PCANC_04056 [Puccinia coronata f. sp. avenae]